jgi:hypothetical protein
MRKSGINVNEIIYSHNQRNSIESLNMSKTEINGNISDSHEDF